jgi:hypothetical protein
MDNSLKKMDNCIIYIYWETQTTQTVTLKNFEQRLPDKELKKGLDYFNTHHVFDLEETASGRWKARVRGAVNYKVAISLEGIELLEVSCDCPVGTPYCKHVIAILYTLRERLGLQIQPGDTQKITAAIDELQDKNLRTFLLKYSDGEEGFRKVAEAYALAEEGEREKELFEILIRNAARAVTESYGGIEEDSIGQVLKPVYVLLERAEKALLQDNYQEVVDITLAVIVAMADIILLMEQSSIHPENCIYDSFELLDKAGRAGIPKELRARLFRIARKESVKSKYDLDDLDVSELWLELMEIIDPEKNQ